MGRKNPTPFVVLLIIVLGLIVYSSGLRWLVIEDRPGEEPTKEHETQRAQGIPIALVGLPGGELCQNAKEYGCNEGALPECM